ncbi:precorrin-3B synthase [Hyphomicrobium sp.]|uniref:precorrin-3B synthase n=1 Tax=Hyphomicrobium sp. TaxID=82 RepID=UPI000F93699D|nr:precorrin-3B synthase [Hyphomicrobium sp.]RUP09437.1 MAG: precorrin-3B synthase [Hyphomicrobium sp.]
MTVPAHLIKGWCPGALRPMRSGDGLIVRIKPRAGAFSISALAAIADAAARFGSGEIDLTNRGNLQLRGVSDDSYDDAITALRAADLIDRSAAVEAVRNVVVDPLSGIDPERPNVCDVAARIEDALADDARLWALPGKFGFSFSGSSEPMVGGRAADIMIAAAGDGFDICLDGATDLRCEVTAGDVIDSVRRLAMAFLDLAAKDHELRRMKAVVARFGAARIFELAGLQVTSRSVDVTVASVSAGLLSRGDLVFGVGIGLPFGRITADQLGRLCQSAEAAKLKDVFTSPQRILVFPVAERAKAELVLQAAASTGLIVVPEDARLQMDVCPGSSGCRNATTDTRADARHLVDVLNGSLSGYSVHVSGCEKGCARQSAADFTLIARAGRYDLIRNGVAGDPIALANVDADDIGNTVSRFILDSAS